MISGFMYAVFPIMSQKLAVYSDHNLEKGFLSANNCLMLIYSYAQVQLPTMKNIFSEKKSFYLLQAEVFCRYSIVVMFTHPILAKSFVLRFMILILTIINT